MRTLLTTLTLLCSSAVMANGNPAQQAPLPMNLTNAMQAVPQQSAGANPASQANPAAISPEMLRLLMQQAEQQAGQEAAQAREDTSNARINDTQRQQQ